jgi:hypothetical protein
MAALPTRWRFNGSAFQDATSGGAILTLPVNNTAGTVIYDTSIPIDAFSVSFEFRIGFASHFGTDLGSDGIGFMLEQTGNTAIGQNGGGMGMGGLVGYGVEIDTFDHVSCNDFVANHIAIDDLILPASCPEQQLHLISNTSLPFELRNSGWHVLDVDWNFGDVRIALDHIPVLSYVIPTWVSGQSYYMGFAAAGGFNADLHEIRNIRITFSTPRCL